MTKFQCGDKVQRRLDVFDSKSPYRYGRIRRVYSTDRHNELYDVEWDDNKGIIHFAYLPHGLEPSVDSPKTADPYDH